MFDELLSIMLPQLKFLSVYEEEGKLKAAAGDVIWVIEGKYEKFQYFYIFSFLIMLNFRSDRYWWKGQNQRTYEIGIFPRCHTNPLRPLGQEDISKPLPNSLIHAGKKRTVISIELLCLM